MLKMRIMKSHIVVTPAETIIFENKITSDIPLW